MRQLHTLPQPACQNTSAPTFWEAPARGAGQPARPPARGTRKLVSLVHLVRLVWLVHLVSLVGRI